MGMMRSEHLTSFWRAMNFLSDYSKRLPQVSDMLPLIEMWHWNEQSWYVAILNEVIEIIQINFVLNSA